MTDFKFLHTMLRVKNLEDSIEFYRNNFGMRLIRKKDYPEGKFTLAFIGYGDESNNTVIELTYNWEKDGNYELGNGFGHIAIGVKDIYKVCSGLEKSGINILRKPGPMKHGKTVIAFVEDLDGYKIELIEKES